MKKNPANRSAFLQSRAMVAFATCAFAAFLTLLAYALAPGGRVQAAPQAVEQVQTTSPIQDSNSNLPPGVSPENVYHGQVTSIVEHKLTDLSPYEAAIVTGQNPIPLSQDLPASANSGPIPVLSAPIPIEPAQATATPTPAGAVVLLDTFNGRTVSFTGSTPRTYMGDGFTNSTLTPGTTYVSLRSYTFYMVAAVVANYTDIHARLALWDNYNAASATTVFANNNAFFDVDLGPVNITAAPVFFAVTVTALPPFPFFNGGPSSPWGYSQNFQGSTTGGAVADDNNLT
jgi:hypothetical protein